MPLSVARRSISASTASSKSSLSRAATLASSCAMLLTPISAEVTRASRSVHASASWASDWPRAPQRSPHTQHERQKQTHILQRTYHKYQTQHTTYENTEALTNT